MGEFRLGGSVHENVQALRVALGSRTRALSLLDFARVLNERDGRKRAASTIQKWEQGAEPDLASIRLMADIAGVSFEAFALGVPAAPPARKVAEPLPEGARQSRGGIPAHEALAAERAARKKRA